MKNILFCLFLLTFSTLSIYAQDHSGATDGYELVWSDEFNGETLDETLWNIEVNGNGGGNSELQYYRRDNVTIENDPSEDIRCLVLTAKREEYEGKKFTSGRINGQGKVYFKHGKVEARIKLPSTANGLWPAFWMMGNDNKYNTWPRCGEIDILEMGNNNGISNGTQDRYFNGACHWGYYKGNSYPNFAKSSTWDYSLQDGEYHLFTCIWDEQKIRMYVDLDQHPEQDPYFEMGISGDDIDYSSPDGDWSAGLYFHKNFHLLFNLAIGGNFTGIWNSSLITALNNENGNEAKMFIDWVRVYQQSEAVNIGHPGHPGSASDKNDYTWKSEASKLIPEKNDTLETDEGIYIITSDNIIENPGFEEGLIYWTSGEGKALSSSYFEVVDGGGPDGSTCLRATSNGGSSTTQSVKKGWAVTPGKTYLFQCYAYRTGSGIGSNTQYSRYYESNTATGTDTQLGTINYKSDTWVLTQYIFTPTKPYFVVNLGWLNSASSFDCFFLGEVEASSDLVTSKLDAAITKANELLNNTEEGTEPRQYSHEVRQALIEAIAAATSAMSSSRTQAEINSATSILETAIETYKNNVNPPFKTGVGYNISNVAAGNLNLAAKDGKVVISDADFTDESQVFFFDTVPEGAAADGYNMHNANGIYIAKQASSNWSMTSSASIDLKSKDAIFTVTDHGTYITIKNANRNNLGVDNLTDGSSVYADKSGSETKHQWILTPHTPTASIQALINKAQQLLDEGTDIVSSSETNALREAITEATELLDTITTFEEAEVAMAKLQEAINNFLLAQTDLGKYGYKSLDNDGHTTFDFSNATDFVIIDCSSSVKESMIGHIAADYSVDDTNNFLWIWENTYQSVEWDGALNSFGYSEPYNIYDVLKAGWSGLGYASQNKGKDLSMLDDTYYLHFAIKGDDITSHISHTMGVGDSRFVIGNSTSSAPIVGDFKRDGKWYSFDIPFKIIANYAGGQPFASSDGGSKAYMENVFSIQSGGIAGTKLMYDNVFFFKKIHDDFEEKEYVSKSLDYEGLPTFEFSRHQDYVLIDVTNNMRNLMGDKVLKDYRVDDNTNFLYIWEGTYTDGTPEGINSLGEYDTFRVFKVGGKGWSGLGYASQNIGKDLSMLDDSYYLHIAMKGTDEKSHVVEVGNAKFTVGSSPFVDNGTTIPVLCNYKRDGEWYNLDVPLSDLRAFAPILFDNPDNFVGNVVAFLSGGTSGTILQYDAVFFYKDLADGISETMSDSLYSDNPVIFDISGRKVSDITHPGIYIIKDAKGVRKIRYVQSK